MYSYKCKVLRWIDGDTVELDVDLGFKQHIVGERVRICSFNAPEMNTAEGPLAKQFAEQLVPIGSVTIIASSKAMAFDRYTRWLVKVTLADGGDFATSMIAAGHGVAVNY